MIVTGMVFAGLSFFLSVILVALVLHISRRQSWYDRLDERKIHFGNVPRLGGVGFSLAFIIVSAAISLAVPGEGYGLRFLPVIAGMIIVLCIGILDDFHPLPPRIKLAFQIVAAFLVALPGYTFHRLFFFDIGGFGELAPWISYPLTVLWLVGMTNAVNFIDGVDGLSGGISLLSAATFGLISLALSDSGGVPLLSFSLAAVLAGFLVFNLPLPAAKIFMGYGGALFLGFTLAVLPLADRGGAMLALPLPYAAALLFIPILDVTAAVWRRLRDGHPVDMPDRGHVHHKLMNLGLDARKIDAVLWSLQVLMGALVYIAVKTPGPRSLILLAAAYLSGIVFFSTVHFMNRAANHRKAAVQGNR